jgi:hypothetical protein
MDLYVRRVQAHDAEWDYRPYLIGNNESVTINNRAATYFIMRAAIRFDGVTSRRPTRRCGAGHA